jgi:endonuclease YncB( thermonuclease family)
MKLWINVKGIIISMKSLLDLIKSLYGPKAIASTIGTKTNVVRLPSGKLQKYISRQLDIESASDEAAKNAYNEMKELIAEVPKMNDGERLVFEGNLRRLRNKVKPEQPMAEVIGIENRQPIKGEGLESLIKEAGQTSAPGTMVGNIQSRVNQLKQIGKEMEKQTGEKAVLGDVLKEYGASQGSLARIQDQGLVRSTARQILINDIKAGKIKNISVEEATCNMKEPIDPFRQIYGEDALEQLDSLIPNFKGLKTEMEAEQLARSKFKFEPDVNRPKESFTEEEMKKAFRKRTKK